MATDVDVQYFSHLNGLTLGNNWGDMIRLLDTCLVNGLPFTSVTSASIDAQGDITLNLYAAHNALLFQIVELTGFSPSEINGKYRIKGTPTTTQLILKAEHVGKTISTVGTAKLAALGYEIVFRDTYDVKRVYRAKNPRSEHPFIRVDESISSDTGSYTSTYAKSAMVGLLENMTHIDDYEDPNKLQLPLDTTDFKKNWKITGTGTSVVRGWCKWYWATSNSLTGTTSESATSVNNNVKFTLCGDNDAFYLLSGITWDMQYKRLQGCGLINSTLSNDVIPNWFLMAANQPNHAGSTIIIPNLQGGSPLCRDVNMAKVFQPTYDVTTRIKNHTTSTPITPDFLTGYSAIYSANNVSALEIPLVDAQKYLRGGVKYVFYAGNNRGMVVQTMPILSDKSMFIYDHAIVVGSNNGGFYFYLGELE